MQQLVKMSPADQQQWVKKFQQWVAVYLPLLESDWNKESPDAMRQGLELISAFPYGSQFAEPILRQRSFHSKYVKVLRLACERIIKELRERGLVASEKVMADAASLVVLDSGEVNPSLLSRHVGRPTKMEQQARALQAERDRKASEAKQPPVFSDEDLMSPPAAPQTLSGTIMGGQMLHLDQLRWLMSPELSKEVETIRSLRAAHAAAAERAKTLSDEQDMENPDPVLQQKIAEAAQEAKHYADLFTGIYMRVDDEMATCYVRFKEDTAYIERMQSRGIDPQEMRTMLRPYFDKKGSAKEAFKQKVIEQINANDPAQAAVRQAAAERKQRITAIIKYLTRTDKPNTPTRLTTMGKRIQELATLLPEEDMKKYRDIYANALANPVMPKEPNE